MLLELGANRTRLDAQVGPRSVDSFHLSPGSRRARQARGVRPHCRVALRGAAPACPAPSRLIPCRGRFAAGALAGSIRAGARADGRVPHPRGGGPHADAPATGAGGGGPVGPARGAIAGLLRRGEFAGGVVLFLRRVHNFRDTCPICSRSLAQQPAFDSLAPLLVHARTFARAHSRKYSHKPTHTHHTKSPTARARGLSRAPAVPHTEVADGSRASVAAADSGGLATVGSGADDPSSKMISLSGSRRAPSFVPSAPGGRRNPRSSYRTLRPPPSAPQHLSPVLLPPWLISRHVSVPDRHVRRDTYLQGGAGRGGRARSSAPYREVDAHAVPLGAHRVDSCRRCERGHEPLGPFTATQTTCRRLRVGVHGPASGRRGREVGDPVAGGSLALEV